MDTKTPTPDIEPGTAAAPRSRRVTRVLLGISLATFALPFLTVTCTSEPTTVSGVQAATKIDVYPNDSLGERDVTEHEPINVFAFAALAATVIALAIASRAGGDRDLVVWFAAAGAILLWGFFLYAFFRTIGSVAPGVGLVATIALLTAAAWTAVETPPRWIVGVGAGATLGLVLGVVGNDGDGWSSWLFVGFYAGGSLAVLLSLAAIRSSVRGERTAVRPPSKTRIVAAGIVGAVLLVVTGILGPWLAGSLLDSSEYGASSVGSSLGAAIVLLGLFVVTSVLALGAGNAIVHGRRRHVAMTPMQQVGA